MRKFGFILHLLAYEIWACVGCTVLNISYKDWGFWIGLACLILVDISDAMMEKGR